MWDSHCFWMILLRYRREDLDVMDMDHADTPSAGSRREETSPAAPATDYRSLAPFQAAVTRRRFLQLGGTAAGVAIAAGTGSQLGGVTGAARAAAATKPG